VPFSQNWYRFWSFRTGVLEKVFGPHPPSKTSSDLHQSKKQLFAKENPDFRFNPEEYHP